MQRPNVLQSILLALYLKYLLNWLYFDIVPLGDPKEGQDYLHVGLEATKSSF